MDRQSILATYGIPITSPPRSNSNSGNSKSSRRTAQGINVGNVGRNSKGYSVTALYSMAAEQDVESKKNFILERDVRYLDSRIALLIQNRMALDEKQEVESSLYDTEPLEGTFPDDRKQQQYGNLFFLLQTEPGHIATLCRLVSISEIDTLLQTVMFTLYGNQYESREEHLLLTMFQSVLSAQFETTLDFNSLLRANTPVSRMMTTYTRRGPGQSYLKSVLSERINNLIEHKELNLEINPLKVYEQMIRKIEDDTGQLPPNLQRSVTPDVAAANPDVQKIIVPRLDMLIEIANGFLTTIIQSIDQRKYPDATEFAICSLIGGFFFLRFVNPAIVTPQAYMLVDGIPGNHPRRTLTLIAKMLQNLANKPTYSKEEYMIMINSFVEHNKQRINKFLLELCEVGDFYESLEAPSEKSHLRILLDEIGIAPSQVPRKENRTMQLPLFSRWETPIQDIASAFVSDNVTQNDILYMETKSIFVQLIRSMPRMAEKRPLNLYLIAEIAATSKDVSLVRKGIKVKEMLSELEEARVIDRRDGYRLMTEEVATELAHLGNIREKVTQEIQSLEEVFKTICDHNNYLRSQLDSYKAYLFNVRQHSSKEAPSGIGTSVVKVGNKEKKPQKVKVLGPYKFTYAQLERDEIIVENNVPENRRQDIYFNITSPLPGTFIIALHYKGRDAAILEMDLKLDDLLEKVNF
ncbi:9818_t:CDS:2 [Entrophospora sp. SA101]|nr:9818_t:CDS:2 [Entrophospora sp. SA101]